MIRSFGDKVTREIWETGKSRKLPASIHRAAQRKLFRIHTARTLEDLQVPPGNNLHALKGDRKGQHAIRINDQYRICFQWVDDGAEQVEITDYH